MRDYVHCLALGQTHIALLFDNRRESWQRKSCKSPNRSECDGKLKFYQGVHFVPELHQLMGEKQ